MTLSEKLWKQPLSGCRFQVLSSTLKTLKWCVEARTRQFKTWYNMQSLADEIDRGCNNAHYWEVVLDACHVLGINTISIF